MLKILQAKQIRQLDQFTIKEKKISSEKLMEQASKIFTDWFLKMFQGREKILFAFCGTGNNGGDGLVISRLLAENGWRVFCYIVVGSKNPRQNFQTSQNFQINYKKLQNTTVVIQEIQQVKQLSSKIQNNSQAVILDAIFGSGLNKPISETIAEIIAFLNQSLALRVAVDIPSGLFCDTPIEKKNVFCADFVLSFELPKLGFLFSENQDFVGLWDYRSIGLSNEFIEREPSDYFWIEKKDLKKKLPVRKRHHYKNLSGHALICGGSYGKIGAAILAAKAALKIGAGLVTVQSGKETATPLQAQLPEAMFEKAGSASIEKILNYEKYQSIAIGMGMGTAKVTQKALKKFLSSHQKSLIPLVLDADALNILSLHKKWLSFLHSKTVLTPHIGEFDRLFGTSENSLQRLQKLKEASQKLGIWILLKGAYSALSSPQGKIYFNSSGTSAMATAGSGDVLSGVLAGLLAQNSAQDTHIFDSLIVGIFLHGLAGELAAKKKHTIIASDITQFLGEAYRECQ